MLSMVTLENIHTYGIEIPSNIVAAIYLDIGNGDTLWMDAIYKEMKILCVHMISMTTIKLS